MREEDFDEEEEWEDDLEEREAGEEEGERWGFNERWERSDGRCEREEWGVEVNELSWVADGNENGEWMCDEEDIFKGVEIESETELWIYTGSYQHSV